MTIIPDKYVQFARELRELAVKYELNSVSAIATPGYRSGEWQHPISVNWADGRHGEDAGMVRLETVLRLTTSLKRDGSEETREY